MYSGSVASTGTQGAGTGSAAMSWCQSRSRSPIAAVARGRCTMTVRSGLCAASSIAASRIGLYSMIRATSMPQEAETTTLGLASSIRTASSCGAKPPKTTLCTAPSRAQASIATTASGIIGM